MPIETDQKGHALTLPFDQEQMAAVRLSQADLARLFQVSRSRVCQWVRHGKISVFADGRIDPSRAAAELVKNCNINRLQAKPFKPLRKELDLVRGQLRDLLRERDALAIEATALREALRSVVRRYAEAEAWLARFYDRQLTAAPDAEIAFDAIGAAVLRDPLAVLLPGLDPEFLTEIGLLLPELAAALPPFDGTLPHCARALADDEPGTAGPEQDDALVLDLGGAA